LDFVAFSITVACAESKLYCDLNRDKKSHLDMVTRG